jgi:hypothetical protein
VDSDDDSDYDTPATEVTIEPTLSIWMWTVVM